MSPLTRTAAVLAVLAASFAVEGASPVGAQDKNPSWTEVKCVRYAKAWSEALRRKGAQGLGWEFLETHDAFVASGCTAPTAVCPRSTEELEIANVMVMASFNAEMGSTFTPFSCRK